MEKQLEGLKEYLSQKKEEIKDKKNTKFISVASGKGGVGKTNFTVNFAYVLANIFNKKVLLIDADIGLGNVHILLRLPLVKSLKEVLNGKSLEDNIVNIKNFDVLPGFSGFEKLSEIESANIDKLIDQIEKVSKNYDYVLIDTSAGITDEVVNFIRSSDKSFIITTPEPTAITDAYALIKTMIKIYNYSDFDIVVNMCKSREEGIEVFEKINNSSVKFLETNLRFAGFLPFSEELRRSVLERKLITENFPKNNYTKYLIEIVKEELNIPSEKKEDSFWGKFLSFFKK
ncbi:MAG: MinD/ParA family protein [Hydrogenothermaceae bacterium]|nr:MinD/ParA family protein [Hydrogenothermaceae bacterium]